MSSAPLSFTIPSIHQQTELACRIYHPPAERMRGSRKRGAIIAHPWASFGGSYNDPTVLAAVYALVGEGFVVGTFNFRGAKPSRGSTSWSGKAEVADYTSFVGFFIHYLKQLKGKYTKTRSASAPPPMSPETKAFARSRRTLSSIFSRGGTSVTPMTIVLGGYSYGSVILSNLPPMQNMIDQFADTEPLSTEAKIVQLASQLAARSNADAISKDVGSPYTDRSRAVSAPDLSRPQTHAARAKHLMQSGLKRPGHKSKAKWLNEESWAGEVVPLKPRHSDKNVSTKVMYLFISPVLGAYKRILHWGKAAHEEFWDHHVLVLCGSDDKLASAKAVTKWASGPFTELRLLPAGHLWSEPGASKALQTAIANWVEILCRLKL